MRAALALASLVAAGCRWSAPYLMVTVGGTVSVDALRVTAELWPAHGASQLETFALPTPETTMLLGLPKTFSLQFPGNTTGSVLVSVAGLQNGHVVANGSNRTTISGNGITRISVALIANVSGSDMSEVDMSKMDMSTTDIARADMTMPDLLPPPPVWMPATPAGTPPLLAVWGASADDVYAVGQMEAILHSADRGVSWQEVAPAFGGDGTYDNVWGSSGARVFVVGFAPTASPTQAILLYKTATGFSPAILPAPLNTTQLISVWGTDTEAWAVGDNGVILHSSDGQHWLTRPSGVSTNLFSIWGTSSPLSIYIAGAQGTLLHSSDGNKWTALTAGSADLQNVFGAQNVVIAVGPNSRVLRASDGVTFDPLTLSASVPLASDWAIGSDWFLIAGTDKFNGASIWWSHDDGQNFVSEKIPDNTPGLFGIWGSAVDDVYAVGAGRLSPGNYYGVIYHRQRQRP
jgi:hypothetical protein